MEVSGDDDISTVATGRGRMRVYHALARRTMAGIHCSARNDLQRTALTTSFMRQVVKLGIRKACAELREDSETNDGDASERNENRGGCHQITLVEVPCKGQCTDSVI